MRCRQIFEKSSLILLFLQLPEPGVVIFHAYTRQVYCPLISLDLYFLLKTGLLPPVCLQLFADQSFMLEAQNLYLHCTPFRLTKSE